MLDKENKILILLAHPTLLRSENNKALLKTSLEADSVNVVDLYAEYPNYRIRIVREQERLLEHDVLVFMFPLYWYSTPSILKEWQDLVLESGFAYGANGNALSNKKFLCCITAGASEKFYLQDTDKHYSLRSFLTPLEQMSRVTGMQFIPPYILFDSRTAKEEDRLDTWLETWKKVLNALKNDLFKSEDVINFPILNHYFNAR